MASPKEINSIIKGANVLKCLFDGVGKIVDISRNLDYNQATVYRILKSLEKVGFATQDPLTRQYFPGPHIQSLASNPLQVHQMLIRSAREDMESLRDKINESVSLEMARGSQRVTVQVVEANQEIRYFCENGHVMPIYSSAAGKILLTQFEPNKLKPLLKRIYNQPDAITRTIGSKESLFNELKKIKRQGYSITIGEDHEGCAMIAVPIKNYPQPVSLGVAGPEERIKIKKTKILRHIKGHAANISDRLKNIF
ncbi:MAG: IclR family transcriptional regulator [Deltaproteobacteria bacterium]|nr:IclR family transcriptional regulator [Deltaproteobacteria bacterium]